MADATDIGENGVGPIPTRKRVRVRLSSAALISAEMCKIYRMARSGEGGMTVDQASKLMHMLAVISRQHTENEIERRLEALGRVDKWRSQRRIDVMSMKPRKLSAVLS